MAYEQIGPGSSEAGFPRCIEKPEAATNASLTGAPHVVNAAGYLEECADDPTTFAGFSTRDGENTAAAGTKLMEIHLAQPYKQFTGVLVTAGLTQTMLFAQAGLKKGADGIWYLDLAAVNKTVIIEGWESDVAIGDANPRVNFSVLDAAIQKVAA